MKAVLYETFGGDLFLRDVPTPDPARHGVVLRILATGICLSDWHGWQGHDRDIVLPHVPGHELVGKIVAVGKDVKRFNVGERVTVPFSGGCGSCHLCQTGNQQICDHHTQPGFTHWGSFAEFMKLDFADVNLVRVPEEITNETACLLGCRFITAFRAIVDQGRVRGGEYVAIHGCGGVGLSAVMIASAMGAQVIAIDINDDTLRLAKELGAVATINARSYDDVVGAVMNLSQGGVHVSVDALGSQETCFHSIANLRKRGRHVQVGLMAGDSAHPNVPMNLVMAHELEILGSHGMQAHKYGAMLDMIRVGTLSPDKLLEKTISLEESLHVLPEMDTFDRTGVVVINAF